MEKELEFKVDGMSCGNCVAHVKKALEEIKGVEAAQVSLEEKTVKVSTNGQVSMAQIRQAIEDAGYDVI
ncbi:heavy-metal-associated domain-containing protein [Advenella alkanexedens]|jgi:Cu2+-exporting ATPase/Cu+-exporting ATPase|uniref:Heavy-metal-associated domain-containing protein n=1 Tax=Advenella alkanexedens TaxID=1481665 RepID=A0ABS6NMW5_9BURK|nr:MULTISPECIES: heavy metal-associated domain-containing protein [Advenella]MBV4396694.1 heavy-metal-associated domain-containing protein [Advenella alkanexedens]MDD3758352.1 heavy metal-associated domain-containing protein [Advenella sp.]NLN66547.1 heavy-metal-associated domain-containing protein [Alcaligenaceae bacterium]